MSQRSTSPSPSRVLRVGLIQGGRVLEERLVRTPGPITVGTDPGNTLVVADDSVGRARVLFERRDGAYWLKPDDLAGQVALDGRAALDLSALPGEALAAGALKLGELSRGRVQLGDDLLILFHFVSAPAKAPPPTLPASARRGWVKQIEPIFSSVLTLSFLAHAVMTVLVFQVEPPPPVDQSRVMSLIERLLPPAVEVRTLPNEVKLRPMEGPLLKETAKQTTAAAAPQDKPRARGRGDGLTQEQVQDAVRSAARDYLAKIASVGDSGSGTSELMDISDGLSSVSTSVSGRGVSTSGSRFGKRIGTGGGGERGIDIGPPSLGPGAKRRITSERNDKTELPPVIIEDEIEDIDGDIDRRVVIRRLKAKAGAFQACYEGVLKTQPTLKGKLGLEIVIAEGGRIGSVEVVADRLGSPAVASCVKSTARRVRMPAPKGGDVVIAYTLVFSPR
jgi:hypothetical protein